MKIATYNVWNESKNIALRKPLLVREINEADADIIGLQEVTPHFFEECLCRETQYPYRSFMKYQNDEEGLAVLSKFPILSEHPFTTSRATSLFLDLDGRKISVTNLHLPWDSALEKERQICETDAYIHEHLDDAGLHILLGDFNGGMNTSVHRYLVGDQSLNGCEANPYWDELATGYQALSGTPILPTLDLLHNPRWKGRKSAYPPTVMDRIYILETSYSVDLEYVGIFGTAVCPDCGWSASDHYGVCAEISFR